MPLLKGRKFDRVPVPQGLRDDDEVFYCEATKEAFKNHEEYFERVMLTSSMVWTCEFTGKPNLTFAEAIESETNAKETVRQFPKAIRGPMILVTAQTKRSALSELIDDVFGFIKDRFFVDETIDVLHGNKYRQCQIVEVITPNTTSSSPVKHEKIRYKVKANDEKQPPEWVAMPENIRRDKRLFSKEKCKLFLKRHIESSNAQPMFTIKEASFKKYVTDKNLQISDVFVGKMPQFETSKKLIDIKQKEERKSLNPSKKKTGEKQQSIQKYLNKSDPGVTPNKPKMTEKQRQEQSKKLKEDMERLKREREEKEAERKKRLEEEKAELNAQVNLALKEMNQVREDLELPDQRVLPKPTKVKSAIGDKRFGDFVQILEFMHTFSELLSIKYKFPNGINIHILERALLLKEVNGPLPDILQVLLSTIFSLQVEEANEIAVSFEPNAEISTRRNDSDLLRDAARVGVWCEKHYSMHLNELAMDPDTISELLRLHFLSSGGLVNGQASNWRYQHRGGYLSHDDPGFQFCQDEPHILRALATYTVYQLPQRDIIKIIRCLIDQILSYSSVRDLIEDRLEKAQKAKYTYRQLCFAEKRREEQHARDKREMKEDLRKTLKEFTGPKTEREKLKIEREEEMEKKFVEMDRKNELEKAKFIKEGLKLKEQFFDYQTYLGSDRAGRNYWLFESLPGLFLEHDFTFAGKCYDNCPDHNPGLANCSQNDRNKYIRQMVIDKKNNDKENTAVNGLKPSENGKKEAAGGIDANNTLKSMSQTELFMCTADPSNCPIHTKTIANHAQWSFFHTEEELDALINGLNPRGYREKPLRENIELERDLILSHIRDCPVDQIVIEDYNKHVEYITNETSTKYPNPTTEKIDTIFESRIRQDLLDFEFKLSSGYLGNLDVKNRIAWRTALENYDYDQQADSLTWGTNKRFSSNNQQQQQPQNEKHLTNGHSNDNNLNDSKESDETDLSEDTRNKTVTNDPGYNLHFIDKVVIDSEESQDEALPLHESDTLKEKVQKLASALLQIEQGIDGKFIRNPFGPKRDTKNWKNNEIIRQKRLERWEESLMRSKTYSQVSLHYNVLYDAIVWSRSAVRQLCSVCRRSRDPELTLLCDECNRGYHTYCLKPKLKDVPEGDWFCPKCKPENYIVRRTRKRKIFTEVEEDEQDDEAAAVVVVESRRSSFDEPLHRPTRRSAKRAKLSVSDIAAAEEKESRRRSNRKRKRSRKIDSDDEEEEEQEAENDDDDTDNEPLARTLRIRSDRS